MKNGWMPNRTNTLGALNDPQIAGTRFILAAIALLVIYFDPSEPDHLAPLTYAALTLYTIYSASIYGLALRVETFSRAMVVGLVLGDVLIYSLLVCLSSGTNSIFFSFYLFAILVACSRLGAYAGVIVTCISALLFIGLSYATTPPKSMEWNRFFLRSMSLLLLGYVLSYWAAGEVRMKGKLELLKEISLTANPRFGVDRTTGHFMRCVLEFFKADMCVFLEYDRETQQYQLRRATSRDPEAGSSAMPMSSTNLDTLAGAVRHSGIALYAGERRFWKHAPTYRVCDPATQVAQTGKVEEASTISEWLGCESFVAVPLRHHELSRGHLLLSATRRGAFRMEDAMFLLQVADQIMPILQHIRLVDRLASDTAAEERRRIARSVHDRVIQPYIGLQLGLKAVHLMVQSAALSRDKESEKLKKTAIAIERLRSMASEGIEELRQYVYGLRSAKATGEVLMDSLLRYAARFEAATGIRITVIDRLGGMDLNGRLAAEIFQMAAEALSNVHRHTSAKSATLSVSAVSNATVVLRVENDASANEKELRFHPGSIAEHTEALGGNVKISNANGRTVVQTEIPL